MIDFTISNSANAPRYQRTARRLLIAACSIIGIGVIGSIATTAIGGRAPETKLVADQAPAISVMANTASSNATVEGGVELIHDNLPVTSDSHVVWMNVTAYCPCPKCCGKQSHGITASGLPITTDNGRFAAAPAQYTFGTKLIVPGYNDGKAIAVLDRGGAIKGNHLDLFFPTHEEALKWGRKWIPVVVQQ
jgi:3D (Asp-Asp-Asp) domain-containing protein